MACVVVVDVSLWWGVQLVSCISSVHLVGGVVRLRWFRVIGQCGCALWDIWWRWGGIPKGLVMGEVVSVVVLGLVVFFSG